MIVSAQKYGAWVRSLLSCMPGNRHLSTIGKWVSQSNLFAQELQIQGFGERLIQAEFSKFSK
jgi:hypothetical protein